MILEAEAAARASDRGLVTPAAEEMTRLDSSLQIFEVLGAEPERRPEFVIRGLSALEVAAEPAGRSRQPVALTG